MNRKKYGIFFGAVAIALLMISSATAVTIPQSNESSVSGTTPVSSINHVEPGIYLSGSDQRNILSDALNFVDDPDFHILLQEIVKKMDSKGFVDSSDIERIISDNNLVIGTLLAFADITTGGPHNPYISGGWAMGLFARACILSILPVLFLHYLIAEQNPGIGIHHYPQITIKGKYYDYGITGWAIDFRGMVSNSIPIGTMIFGRALLISIKDWPSTQQSSQQIT